MKRYTNIDGKAFELPSDITVLEYIQSTGTQYINTGYKLITSTDTVSITVENLSTTNNLWNFGCYPSPMFGFSTGTYHSTNNIGYQTLNQDTTHTYETGKHTWLADSNGLSVDTTHLYDYKSFTSSYNLYLFALCNGGSANNYSACKIYNYKQTRDGNLLLALIPAKNSSGTIGMYDLITKTFFENQGTGVFTAGPEAHILPDEYTELEYIQSSGTQYIDTGITSAPNLTVSGAIMHNTKTTTVPSLFSSAGGHSSGIIITHWGSTESFATKFGGSEYLPVAGVCKIDVGTKYTVSLSSNGFVCNGTTYPTSTGSTFIGNLWIGYDIWTEYTGSSNIYWAKIENDTTVLFNGIPAKRNSDSVIGMYDTVTKTFYTNSGTGTFTAGPEISGIDIYKTLNIDNESIIHKQLPAEYDELEYLQSSGTQHIDTGILSSSTTYYDITFAFTESSSGKALYGAVEGSQANDLQINQIRIGNTDCLGTTLTANQKYNFKWDSTGCYLDGTSTGKTPGSGFPTSNNIYLFRANSSITTYYASGKIYNCKIYNASTLVRNFIPAKRKSDSILGMYDTVSGAFFTNAGTGTFIAGPVISVPSGYTKLEYIQGDGTAYIDTGITGDINTSVKLKVYTTSTQGNLFGFRDSASTNNISIAYSPQSPKIFLDFNNSSYDYYRAGVNTWPTNQTLLFETGKSVRRITNLDTSTVLASSTTECSDTITTGNLYLCQTNGSPFATNPFYGNIYYCQIYNGTTLIRYFIPARRNSDGVVGMYDTVNDVFYTNSGTGTFIAGPEAAVKHVNKMCVLYTNPNYHNLPSEYTEVEYVQANGNQYINTGVTPLQLTKIYTKGSLEMQNTAFFGCGTSSYASDRFLLCSSPSSNGLACRLAETISFDNTYNYTDVNEIEVDIANSQMTVNGDSTTTISHTGTFSSQSLYLFAANYDSMTLKAKGKIYYFKAYNGNTLVRDLIPAKNSSDEIGMYDTVSGTFYANSGTDTFTAGPEVLPLAAKYLTNVVIVNKE